jgi:hypothetical protein
MDDALEEPVAESEDGVEGLSRPEAERSPPFGVARWREVMWSARVGWLTRKTWSGIGFCRSLTRKTWSISIRGRNSHFAARKTWSKTWGQATCDLDAPEQMVAFDQTDVVPQTLHGPVARVLDPLLLERCIGPSVAQGHDGTLGRHESEDAIIEGSADLGPVTQASDQSDALARCGSSHAEMLFGVVLEVLEAEPFPSLVFVELEQEVGDVHLDGVLQPDQ